MRKYVRVSILAAFVSLIAACGGADNIGTGTGATTPTTPGTTTCPTGQTLNSAGVCVATGTGTTPSTGGSGIAASLAAVSNPTQIVADGVSTSQIKATLLDTTGLPIAGAPVTFETNAGSFATPSVNTDASGNAISFLKSNVVSGRATVTVRHPASGLSQQLIVTYVPSSSSVIKVFVSPTSVRPGGVATVGVTVTDANGNAISGEPVSLSISTNSSQGQLQSTLLMTDASGQSSTTYSAGSVQGTDTLKATLTSGAAATANLGVLFVASAVGAIDFTAGATAAVADGTTRTALRAAVTDTQGAPLPGISVSFSATAGMLPNPPTATTDSNGLATIQLTSPNLVGTAQLSASTGGFSDSGSIQFVAGAPSAVVLSPAPTNLPPNGVSSVRATVSDAKGNRVPNVTLNLALNAGGAGGALSSSTGTTDANGDVVVQYTAPNVTTGMDTIKATTTNGTNNSVQLNISSGNVTITGLTLTPAATQVATTKTLTVRATVQVQSGSANGITVNFTTSAGSIAATAMTDSSGVAMATLTAPAQPGSARLTAAAGNFNQTANITIVSGDASSLTLSPAPANLPPNGVSSVRATVIDGNGNPVSGVTLNLSLMAGGAGGALSTSNGTTDSNGNLVVQYTAPNIATGTDTIKATTTSGVSSTAQLNISSANAAITGLAFAPAATQVAASGSIVVRATVQVQSGSANGIAVNFTTSAGSIAASAMTDANGVATATLAAPAQTGTARLTAAAGNFSQTASITVVSGEPNSVVVSPAPTNLPPNGVSSVRATVSDANGNRVVGTTVSLSINAGGAGGALSSSTGTTDANGDVVVQYTAPNVTTGMDTIKATTTNGTNNSVQLNISSGNVKITGLTLTPAATQVATTKTLTVRATVQVQSGSANGITVNFTTSAGSIAATAMTDSSGVAMTTLTAPAQPGNTQVTASAGSFTQSATIAVVSGDPASIALVASPTTASINRPATLVATVLDASSNPVQGTSVKFEVPTNISGGTLATVNVTTDANGRASTSYTTGGVAGTDVLKATVIVGSASQSGQVNLPVVVNASQLTLTSSNAQLTADGTSQATLTARLTDANGSPINGAAVNFATNVGTFGAMAQTINVNTDASGNAATRITAPTKVGNAAISATVPGLTISAPLSFVAGAPKAISLMAAPSTVAPGTSSTLTATVMDTNNNPVVGGTVLFKLAAGGTPGSSLSGISAATDANGQARITYTAGGTAGNDLVTADPGSGVTPASAMLTVNALPQTVTTLALTLSSNSVATTGSAVGVRATVLDQNGTPIANQAVSFTASAGMLSAASANTNNSGVATVNITPPTFVTSVTLRAEVAGLAQQQTLSVVPGAASAGMSSITASPTTIVADGVSTSTITIIENDANGNPLPDGTSVTLLSTAGTILGSNTTTLSSGRASFRVQSATANGSSTLKVQDVPALAAVLNFQTATNGTPASLSFSASATRLSVIGVGQGEQATITVSVADSSGNLIKETDPSDNTVGYGNSNAAKALNNLRAQFVTRPFGGESLTGSNSSNAVISDTSGVLDVRTQGGVAVITLRSGTRPGIVEVRFSVLAFNSPGAFGSGTEAIAASASLPQISIASGPPSTIVFTSPVTNSVFNLQGGSYQRIGQAVVTDRYGNSVPDGTVVNFGAIDSVLMHDNTGATTANVATLQRSGASLIRRRCSAPLNGGEAPCATSYAALTDTSDFTSSIIRNDNTRTVSNNDTALLRNVADADKRRFVDTSAGSPSATQLTVQSPYRNANAAAEMWVGAALSGIEIFGSPLPDPATTSNLTKGTGTVTNGIANFIVRYPANDRSILTGCYGYPGAGAYANGEYDARDRRDSVPQSRQVVISADSGGTATAIRNGTFCFAGIAPVVITFDASSVSVGGGSANGLTVTDSGDSVILPYVDYRCVISSVTTAVSWKPAVSVIANNDALSAANIRGRGAVLLTATGTSDPADTATVSCFSGNGPAYTFGLTP